jgi:dihydroorotase
MQKKGEIKQGNDADLVLVDLFKENEVQDKNVWTKVGWSPFSGRNLVGWPQLTIVNGTPVFKRDLELDPKGELLVQMGQTGSRLICSN